MVDVDLQQFFDRVNHDVLMGKLGHRMTDCRILGLFAAISTQGSWRMGVVQERYEDMPQGEPLSPLLANVLLDAVDKELERRGHRLLVPSHRASILQRSAQIL